MFSKSSDESIWLRLYYKGPLNRDIKYDIMNQYVIVGSHPFSTGSNKIKFY